MKVIAHNNKVIYTRDKKILYTQGIYHATGTVDYRGYNAGATITVPYTRPERNVLLTARCVGIWYKNADEEWELSEECDFSLTGDTVSTPVPMTFLLLSPSIQNPGFNFKNGSGTSVWMRNLASCEVAVNLVSITGAPISATFASNAMVFNASTLSCNITNGHRFASTKFGMRYQYHIYAWGDTT